MTAILTACAIAGVFPGKGHCYYVRVPEGLETCERIERPRAERAMQAAGQIVRLTRCNEVKEPTT